MTLGLRATPDRYMRRIYDHVGLMFTQEFAEQLKQHIGADRWSGADWHAYYPAEFGIDRSDLPDRAPLYRPDSAIY